MSRPEATVLVPVRARQRHLDKLLERLRVQTLQNFEVVISVMQQDMPDLPVDLPYPVHLIPVPGERLPLAAARNRGADWARSDKLVFLDVDCIPHPALVERYAEALEQADHCWLGEVRYLPAAVEVRTPQEQPFEHLRAVSIAHPARPLLPQQGVFHEPDRRALWGLSFAMRRDDYFRCGCMDEAYEGYGGEESDFAESFARHGIRLIWIGGAQALHQYHPVHFPPLHRFQDIVANAQRFHNKWGKWCMEYWLLQFCRAGLIDWHPDSPCLRILRTPAIEEIAACLQPPQVAFA